MLGQDDRATSKVAPGAPALRGIWLTRGKDGRLTAYVAGDDGLRRWSETRPGGPQWDAPDVVRLPALTHLSVAQNSQGYVHFAGRRERPAASGGVTVDIVHAIQYQTGRPVTSWNSLGNPHKEADVGSRFGAPVVVVKPSGEVHVAARNGRGGMMVRRERADGKWRGWEDLRCTRIKEVPAVVVLDSGCLEIFASTDKGTLYWQQEKPGGGWGEVERSPFAVSPGSLAVLETAPGRATYFWTDPSGGVVAYRADGSPMELGGAPGDGGHAVIRTELDGLDCTVLAHRGANGAVAVGVGVTENEAGGVWWSDTGAACLGTPALTHDALGRVVMAAVGTDGAPRVTRQTEGPGLGFDEWRAL
ncbi:PLL family lectin [Streptomyces sp. DT9]